MLFFKVMKISAGVFGAALVLPLAGHAQTPVPATAAAATAPTYADLATLSEASELVIRAQIRRQTTLKPERAPDVAPGFARLYVEAQTITLIAGRSSVGGTLAYLVDVPLDAIQRASSLG